jgi:UDP-glucose 4-epimerase
MIKNQEQGIFYPQNEVYSNTSELVRMIAKVHGKKMCLLKGFAWILRLLGSLTDLVNKAFGNLCYDADMSRYTEVYNLVSFEKSIIRSEK